MSPLSKRFVTLVLHTILIAFGRCAMAFGSFFPLGAGPNSGATGLSADGSTICGAGEAGLYWDEQRQVHLISSTSAAFGISGDGQRIVGVAPPGNAFLYSVGQAVEIISQGQANGISRDSEVVVGTDRVGNAFKWSRQSGKRLLTNALATLEHVLLTAR